MRKRDRKRIKHEENLGKEKRRVMIRGEGMSRDAG